MMRSAVTILSALTALIGALALADKTPAKSSEKPAVENVRCSGCRERKPVIDPANLDDVDNESRPAYAAAAKYPETIDKLHCFCGCEESPNLHHVSLLTCYTSLHATGCEICRGEAELAGKMKSEGSSDDEIKKVVESFYQK
jgi:hypothetical protein